MHAVNTLHRTPSHPQTRRSGCINMYILSYILHRIQTTYIYVYAKIKSKVCIYVPTIPCMPWIPCIALPPIHRLSGAGVVPASASSPVCVRERETFSVCERKRVRVYVCVFVCVCHGTPSHAERERETQRSCAASGSSPARRLVVPGYICRDVHVYV